MTTSRGAKTNQILSGQFLLRLGDKPWPGEEPRPELVNDLVPGSVGTYYEWVAESRPPADVHGVRRVPSVLVVDDRVMHHLKTPSPVLL